MHHRFPFPLVLLTAAVAFAHWAALHWAAGQVPVALKAMPEPIFGTLLVQQREPAKKDKTAPASRPARPATKPAVAITPQIVPEPVAPALTDTPPLGEPEPIAEIVDPVEAEVPVPARPAHTDRWPTDTRLTYDLKGYFRGKFYGNAKVQWQRQDDHYQVEVDIRLPLFIQLTLTSQGKVGVDMLEPQLYHEVRPGRIDQLSVAGNEVRLNSGQITTKPQGMQDTASQFVALSQRFATQPDLLQVGGEVSLWLGRPNGVDLWTYDIVAEDTLQTSNLGPVQAFHLKPRPLAKPRGPIMAELWFAPSLQYLPVRILITQGDNTFVDLIVEKIEQAPPIIPAPPARFEPNSLQ